MTRRDYELLAEVFAATRPDPNAMSNEAYSHTYWQWERDIRVLCDRLSAENPRFDRTQFQFNATNPDGRQPAAQPLKET